MSALTTREGARGVLADHFVMWHRLEGPDTPPGEWRCSCGEKFGFSDSAIDHQADALLASGAVVDAATLADDDALLDAWSVEYARRNGPTGYFPFYEVFAAQALASALSERSPR